MTTNDPQPEQEQKTPTTEEALPEVDLTLDPEAERISRETLGPDAATDPSHPPAPPPNGPDH